MDSKNDNYVRGAIEALLFVSDKPVTLDQIREVLTTVPPLDLRRILLDLQKAYDADGRGMVIVEMAGGYQMLSSSAYAEYIRDFFKTRVKERLSRPALETLAIVAYKQPLSRLDVEMIRGVNSDGVVAHLLDKGLIKIVGRKDVPGRPYLYGTTKLFLEYFGLKALNDLPKLEEFPALYAKSEPVAVVAGGRSEVLPLEPEASGETQGGQTVQDVTADSSSAGDGSAAEEPALSSASSTDEPLEEQAALLSSASVQDEPEDASAEDTGGDADYRHPTVPDLKKAMEEVEREQAWASEAPLTAPVLDAEDEEPQDGSPF